jgi:SEC-C motif-containing protein
MKHTDQALAQLTCPCGRLDARGKSGRYLACCGRYIEDWAGTPAPDAASLMRSRYSAFVLGRLDYLRASWDPAHLPSELTLDPTTRWLGLELRRQRQLDDGHAEVEFVARYREGGRGMRLHERSRFVRRDGRWWYVDGDWLS